MIPAIAMSIITIVLVIYGMIFYTKTKQTRTVAELDEQKSAVFNIPVDAVVLKLKQMHLSGKTQNVYTSWANEWDTLVKTNLPEIEVSLEKAEQLSSQLKLLQAKRELDHAKELVEQSEQKAFQINEALQTIVDSESSSSQEIETINANYQALRSKILTNRAEYKDVFPTLESKLSDIEANVATFRQLMEEADYIEAKSVLSDVDASVKALDAKLEKVSELYALYDVTFVEQINEIEDGHNMLLAEEYKFVDIDIPLAITQLRDDIADGRRHVVALDLELADELIEQIENGTERLYAVMENEISAKDAVQKLVPKVESRITQILASNEQVVKEIDRASMNYELTDDESDHIVTYKTDLEAIHQEFEEYKEALENKRLVFTTTKDKLMSVMERLTDIDSKQATMMQSLTSLRQREQIARDQVDNFEFELRNMKRSLERQHLPGLSQLYLDLFFATTENIEALEEKLNRIKINMKEIDALVSDCTRDVEKLDEATEAIIDNATLTEQLVQYANRYRMEYAAIEKAITVAINLYQYQYKYTDARKTIADALDKVEAGASEKVNRLYQAEKNRRF